jgi:hypothetical protein
MTAMIQWKVNSRAAIASRETPFCDLHQPVHDADRPAGRLALGAMQRVVVARALVVLQIDLDRLGEQDVVHVVRDEIRLPFADQSRDHPTREINKVAAAIQQPSQRTCHSAAPLSGAEIPAVTASTMSFMRYSGSSGKTPWITRAPR